MQLIRETKESTKEFIKEIYYRECRGEFNKEDVNNLLSNIHVDELNYNFYIKTSKGQEFDISKETYFELLYKTCL